MHKLIIEDDEGKEVVFPLIRLEISIGRQDSNLVCLTQRNISRRHARLLRRDGRYILEDLSSYVGTRVNGELIAGQTPLNAGDRIEIGDYRMAIIPGRPHTPLKAGPVKVGPGATTPAAPAPTTAPGAVPTSPLASAATAPLAFTPASPRASGPVTALPPGPPPPLPPPLPPGPTPTSPAWGSDTDKIKLTGPPPARLVALTSPWTGREFVLRADSIVIGRTPDNDIILPHKSVAPHHVKILRDGERYVIVDLHDGKGLTVNGAAYRRVELKSGDIVALGRIRLRFVAADDYRAVLEGEGFLAIGSPRRIAIGLGVIAALGAAFVAVRMVDRGGRTASNATLPVAAENEQRDGTTMEGLERAFERKDYPAVLKGVDNLRDGDVHAARVRTLAMTARSTLVSQHLHAAEKQRVAGNCELARKEAEAALALESYNQAAQGLIARCAGSRATTAPLEHFAASWRPAAIPPTRARPPGHERPVRGHPSGSQPGDPAWSSEPAVVDIAPQRAPGEKARHRVIDSSDPYAKDRL